MDNKFKTSKYAAIILASTMALSTVASVTPQAFGEAPITAKAADDSPTVDSVTSLISELSVNTITETDEGEVTYKTAVSAAKTAYGKLSADDKAKVKNAKVLTAHEAIVAESGLVAAIKALPTAESFVDADGNAKYDKYSLKEDNKTPLSIEKTDKKGKKYLYGQNKELEDLVTALNNFKKAYDSVSGKNKEAKSLLSNLSKTYSASLKTATAAQAKVAGSFDAIEFDKLYDILKNGGTYQETEDKAVKINKKGVFTVDGDKYTATYDMKTGFKVVGPNGSEEKISGNFTIDLSNNDEDDVEYVFDEDKDSVVYVNGVEYTLNSASTGLTYINAEGETKTVEINDNKVTIDEREYTIGTNSEGTKTLTSTSTTTATLDDTYKLEYVNGAVVVKKVVQEWEINGGTREAGKGIPLRGLNKSLSISEYKKLKAGATEGGKYTDAEIEIINATEAAQKALTAAAKKIVSKDTLADVKKYTTDVKVQSSLEKKVTTTDAKGVTTLISKLKYKDDTAVYEKDIKAARSAYKALSAKYKKKVKAASLKVLEGQEKAIKVIKEINNLDTSVLVTATTESEVKAFQAELDKIAKADKSKAAGGTGSYYEKLDKKQRSYVKNIKTINNLNKLATTQLAYVKQKSKVDKFEDELTAISGSKTVRIVNDMFAIDDKIYTAVANKKDKSVTITTPDSKVEFVLANNTTKEVDLQALEELDGLKILEIKGDGSETTPYNVEIGDKSYKTDDELKVGNYTFKAKVTKDKVSFVAEEVAYKDTKEIANNGTLEIGEDDDKETYKVTISSDKATLSHTEKVPSEVEGQPDVTKEEVDGILEVGDRFRGYEVESIADGKLKLVSTADFDGFVLTNTKGKLSVTDKTASTVEAAKSIIKPNDASKNVILEYALPVYSFKGLTDITDETLIYDQTEVKAINQASTVYATLSKDKDAKKFINKEDTTSIKAYEAALKAQKALEQKVLAKKVAALKYSDEVIKFDDEWKVIASDDITTTVAHLSVPYADNYYTAQEMYDDLFVKYADLKDKLKNSYEKKLANHAKASEVAKLILTLPAEAELKITSVSVTGDEETVASARTAYGKLTADQVKLVKEAETKLLAAEAKIVALKAQEILTDGEVTFNVLADAINKDKLLAEIKKLDTATVKSKLIKDLTVDALTLGTGSDAGKKVTVKLAEGITVDITVTVEASEAETAAIDAIKNLTLSATDTTVAKVLASIKATDTTNAVLKALVEDDIKIVAPTETADGKAVLTLPSGATKEFTIPKTVVSGS